MNVIITWLVLMTVGLVMTSWLLRDVLADRRALIAAGITNGRKTIIIGDVRSAWVKVGAFGVFVAIGVIAMLRDLGTVNIDANVSRIGLLAGAALLAWDAVMARRVRQALLKTSPKDA